MKLGYPCLNRTIEKRCNHSFRLGSFNEERFLDAIQLNLQGLQSLLEWNTAHGLLFHRISSDLIPFASHPICTTEWERHFAVEFAQLGNYARNHQFRISMHPDQFVLINSPKPAIVKNSISELHYHARVLKLLGMDGSAKIQIHVGGVYGDKPGSIARFIENYHLLDDSIQKRLVVENDDRLYSLQDCLRIHEACGVPILFDVFHHRLLNHGESTAEALQMAKSTWKPEDGRLMVDYSSQEPGARSGTHAQSLDMTDFEVFIRHCQGLDFDLMLEIKDKEASALRARDFLIAKKLVEEPVADHSRSHNQQVSE